MLMLNVFGCILYKCLKERKEVHKLFNHNIRLTNIFNGFKTTIIITVLYVLLADAAAGLIFKIILFPFSTQYTQNIRYNGNNIRSF
jgi:hypothetical protein